MDLLEVSICLEEQFLVFYDYNNTTKYSLVEIDEVCYYRWGSAHY